MAEQETICLKLSVEQRRLVEANLGLVGVHLRRFVRRGVYARAACERGDLFQEGCLGLAKAARTFADSGKDSFAAYALPRIRFAVDQAIQRGVRFRRFERAQADGAEHATSAADSTSRACPVHVLVSTERLPAACADARRPASASRDAEVSLDELNDKFERALELAEQRMTNAAKDPRRAAMFRILRDERLSIPDERWRTSLREVARRTGTAISSVISAERRLRGLVQKALERDQEFPGPRRGDECHCLDTRANPFNSSRADASRSRLGARGRQAGPPDICEEVNGPIAVKRAKKLRRRRNGTGVVEAEFVGHPRNRFGPDAADCV